MVRYGMSGQVEMDNHHQKEAFDSTWAEHRVVSLSLPLVPASSLPCKQLCSVADIDFL